MKRNNGITLISLVITIVVLIILAGVAINLTIGENGLLKKAQFARDEYNNAVASEEQELNELYAYLTRDDLPENTKENPQDVGTIVKLPDSWQTTTPNYVSLDDGSVITSSTKVATVYAVSVGEGNTVPIPKDFWYVGGNLNTGVVISDKYEDSYQENNRDMSSHEDAINLIGNQFVWVPCTLSEYKKSNWSSDGETQGNVTGKSNCYWYLETNWGETTQIQKYGGFYVGRYEAGLPNAIVEFTGSVANTSDVYNTTGMPQSKAGITPWTFVDWDTSKQSAQKMYEGNKYVTSGLITGTQWDVMITKIGNLTDSEGNLLYSLTNSASWGNYYDGDTNGFTFRGDVAEYKSGYQYAFATPASTTKANKTNYLLKTGASNHNKSYNLYDVAGNVWEWTEESAAYYNSIETLTTNRVCRGGSFNRLSSADPACFRDSNAETTTYYNMGFRVVLYIK